MEVNDAKGYFLYVYVVHNIYDLDVSAWWIKKPLRKEGAKH